jgi:hypothetical protein
MSSDQIERALAYIHILEAENARLREKLQYVKTSLIVERVTEVDLSYLVIRDYAKMMSRSIVVRSLHVRVMYANYENSGCQSWGPSLTGMLVDLVPHEKPANPDTWVLEVVEFRMCGGTRNDTYQQVITYGNTGGLIQMTVHPLGQYPHVPNDDTLVFMDERQLNGLSRLVLNEANAHHILTEFLACGASMHVQTFYYYHP